MFDLAKAVNGIKSYNGEPITIMEVCGTHTAEIIKNGIPSLLSDKIKLVAGPGCPVCVTVGEYADRLVELSMQNGITVASFGDMLRVPGSKGSLKDASARGGSVLMLYSPLELLDIAEKNKDEIFVFAAVGFETTTPVYAVLIDEAIRRNINNIRLLTALKTMPAVIDYLCSQGGVDAFIAPGHVAVITGANAFLPAAEKYNLPFAVSGFSGAELVCSIYALTRLKGRGVVKNYYKNAVNAEENKKAKALVDKYFEPCSAAWRGIGVLENSAVALKKEYQRFDMGSRQIVEDFKLNPACACGEIILGRRAPQDCALFGKVCTPETPQGSCMVSCEGTCYSCYTTERM